MGVRERILTIRLLERLTACPACGDLPGIEVTMGPSGPKSESGGCRL